MKHCMILTACAVVLVGTVLSQTKTAGKAGVQTPTARSSQEMNIRAYIELLRADVRKDKASVLAEVMELSADEAAKFWPIYKDYDAEIARTGDAKLAGIKKYAESYESMTDDVADELAQAALKIEQERHEVKAKYYQKVKQELGGIIAARFLQVENQLLMLIDLQIAASLPVVGSGVEKPR